MPGWEDELAELLRELGVTQEEPRTHRRPASKSVWRDIKRRSQATEAFIFGDAADTGRLNDVGDVEDAVEDEDEEIWLTDLSLMRREVDSIVRQVIHLMQRGDLDKTLKEDVMVVLRALRRRAMVTEQAAVSEAAYLESAAAMLHFCRLVLQLSETAIEDL
jgi:predicted nucleotidyltransferase